MTPRLAHGQERPTSLLKRRTEAQARPKLVGQFWRANLGHFSRVPKLANTNQPNQGPKKGPKWTLRRVRTLDSVGISVVVALFRIAIPVQRLRTPPRCPRPWSRTDAPGWVLGSSSANATGTTPSPLRSVRTTRSCHGLRAYLPPRDGRLLCAPPIVHSTHSKSRCYSVGV